MGKRWVLTSDISGTDIPDGEGVKIRITFTDSSAQYELDALRSEVDSLIQAAHRKPKRQYRRRAVVDSPQA